MAHEENVNVIRDGGWGTANFRSECHVSPYGNRVLPHGRQRDARQDVSVRGGDGPLRCRGCVWVQARSRQRGACYNHANVAGVGEEIFLGLVVYTLEIKLKWRSL